MPTEAPKEEPTVTTVNVQPMSLTYEHEAQDSKTRDAVQAILKRANAISSDVGGVSHLFRYAYHRLKGHTPMAPLLEIGSMRGASALAWMAAIVAHGNNRALVTVDPYCEIAFISSNNNLTTEYNGEVYRTMKENLATTAREFNVSHTHWMCTDTEYFEHIHPNVANFMYVPAQRGGKFAFIYLDANHDVPGVRKQVEWSLKNIEPGGTIIVDDAWVNPLLSGLWTAFEGWKLADIGGGRPYLVMEVPR